MIHSITVTECNQKEVQMGINSSQVFHWSDGTITSHECCGADPDTLEVYWEPPLPDKEPIQSCREWDWNAAQSAGEG